MGKKKAKEKSGDLGIKIIGIILAVLFVVGIGWAICENTGVLQRSTVAVSSENYKIDNAMLNYYYHVGYQNFVNNYSYYISYFFDTSKSLKSQACTFSDGSWFDYFLTSAVDSAKNVLTLCEEAKANGLTLDDADKDSIDETVKAIKEAAKQNGISTDAYVSYLYGTGVKLKDVKKCMELSTLATKQYDKLYNSYSFTEDDLNKYAEENKSAVNVADYMFYQAKADYEDDADEAAIKAARDAAKATAESFKELTDEGTFLGKIRELDEKEEKIDPEDYTAKNAAYGEDTDLEKWLFADERKVNDTTVIASEDENTYTAYIVLKTNHLNDGRTVNVRHILISASSSDSEETKAAAKKQAEDILAEFNAGDKTADSFGKLAAQYTADSNGDQGGLYENVAEGDMVDEFNDWIFDEARKEGDTGIVETPYGYHVMYFAGEGNVIWKLTAENALRNEAYGKDYDALEAKHNVKVDTAKAAKIDVA